MNIMSENKDLCKTCEHHWLDFPIPLESYISHCEILDTKPGNNKMDDVISYPCLKCPFDSYSKKI